MSSLFGSFKEVRAKTAKPLAVREFITHLLDDDDCWDDVEVYMVPPTVTGSTQFDHCMAVVKLLEHDATDKHGRRVAAAMVANSKLTHRVVYDIMISVMRRAGFNVRGGHIVGLLADESEPKPTAETETATAA